MTTRFKALTKVSALAAIAAIAAGSLVGCGEKEQAAAPAAAETAPFKVAFAYVGPVGDGGWTYAHDRARAAVQAEFGDKIVTSYVENVPEIADA